MATALPATLHPDTNKRTVLLRLFGRLWLIKMTTILRTLLLHAVILCVMQTSGVRIESVPGSVEQMIEMKLDGTVSLICRHKTAAGTDMELVWLRNNALVKLENNNRGDNSSICVTPLTHEDNGAIFTCQWKNDTTLNDSVTLNVTYASRTNGSEEFDMEEQETLVLLCDMYANPAVIVSWEFNGTQLEHTTGKVIVTNDGFTSKLTVNKLDMDLHRGTYICETNSPKHGKQRRTFSVGVKERTIRFPVMPIVAGVVVVFLTILLAIFSRRKKIAKCFK
ncbi:unnamed protein product [Gadus morhua 'NCC']